MKKVILSLLAVAVAMGNASARTLSPAEALSRAASHASVPAKVKGLRGASKAPVLTLSEGETPMVYVFENSDSGYLILSADDIAAPVLGYSDSGELDVDNLPDNLAWWLGQYRAEIAAAVAAGETAAYAPVSRANRQAIAPLVTTKWNQDAPYNLKCPTSGNAYCMTGCVATAMAQVMKYHNWPVKGTGSYSYKWGTQTLSMNFAATTFDWANMLDTYSSTATTAQTTAVATLMSACGISVNMSYGTSASGASSMRVGPALIDYFGYDKGARNEFRACYGLTQWEEMIYNDLKANGPIYYDGANDEVGHAFVCDGYSTDGYFHFNWGWGGVSDGYFLLNALNPDSQGIGGSTSGYNSGQMAILGVKKAGSSSAYAAPQVFNADVLTPTAQGSQLILKGVFENVSMRSLSGALGARFVNTSTGASTIVTANPFSTPLKPAYYYSSYQLSTSKISAGTYNVYPVYVEDGTAYDIMSMTSTANYVVVTKTGSTIKVEVADAGTVSIKNFDFKTPFYIGKPFLLSASATFSEPREVQVAVRPLLLKNTTGAISSVVAYGNELNFDIPSDAAATIDYMGEWIKVLSTNGRITAGTYYFAFATDVVTDSNGSLTSFKVVSTLEGIKVQNAPTTNTLSMLAFSIIGNADAVDPADVVFNIWVKCTSGYCAEPLRLYIFPDRSGNVSSEASFETERLFIASGENNRITLHCDFSKGTPGGKYFAAIINPLDNNSWFADPQGKTLTCNFTLKQSGIEDILSTPASGVSVSPNPATNVATVTAPDMIQSIDLVSLSGLNVTPAVDIDGNMADIEVANLPAGIYVARIVTISGVHTAKIVKK